MRRLASLLAVAVIAAPVAAYAWSDPGHRIAAAIAEERLSPAARRLVREIVGSKPLSDHDVATWADDVRDRRTGPWHYVNVPLSAEGYVAARDCPRAGCAVSALEEAAARPPGRRHAAELADSLRWIVHLVADLHQPMHAGELRDRGGNDTDVRIGRRRQPLNVHRLWDAEVVQPLLAGRDPLRAADGARQVAAARGGGGAGAPTSRRRRGPTSPTGSRAPSTASSETFPVAGDTSCSPRDYAESQRARTAMALSKAGVRLAALLDRIAAEREARRR